MRVLIFNALRYCIRTLFTIPERVRRLRRTLLVWCRISRIYHESGVEGLKRWRTVRGVSRDNLRRKSSPRSNNNRTPFPPYRD
jgi:hypothetical protein